MDTANQKAMTLTTGRESIINLIRSNLDDKRYGSIHCIIQELIQNSDDAKSTRMLIGYGSLQGAQHSLLKSPGLFVVNDGKLSLDDLNHLFRIAESNKTNTDDKIGHFGLGMKSVFHICEAFFLFFNQPENAAELNRNTNFLDPWFGDSETPDIRLKWNQEFNDHNSELNNLVKDYVNPWVHDWKRWFCLWVPLRTNDMLDENCPAISEKIPVRADIEELLSIRRSSEIAELLPFLSCLAEITLIDNGNIIDKISLSAARRLQKNASGPIDAVITHHSTLLANGNLAGNEQLDHDQVFTDLKAQESWPKATRRVNGKAVPESLLPHTAIFWLRSPRQAPHKGKLRIRQCVFLPLTGVEQNYEIELNHANFDLTLYVHANFFVDAGRQGFDYNLDSDDIKKRWNYYLLTQSLLPMIIPSLARMVEQKKWMQEEITSAVTALECYFKNSELKLNAATTSAQYLYCLMETGWKWVQHSSQQDFLRIPETNHSSLQKCILKHLGRMSLLLVSAKTQGITSKKSATLNGEHLTHIIKMIQSAPQEIKYSKEFLRWIDALLCECPIEQQLQTALIKAYLQNITFSDYQQLETDIYQFLRCLPDAVSILYLAQRNWQKNSFPLWKQVALQAVNVVPMLCSMQKDSLPIVNDNNGKPISIGLEAKYSEQDLKRLLPEVENLMRRNHDHEASRALLRAIIFNLYIQASFAACDEEELCKFKLFPFKDQDGKNVLLSLAEIKDRSRTIFLGGGDTVKLNLVSQAAEISFYIYQDTSNAENIAFLEKWLVRFSLAQVDKFFNKNKLPKLKKNISSRKALFEALVKENINRYFHIIRYLLLEDKENFEKDESLDVIDESKKHSNVSWQSWERLLKFRRCQLKNSIQVSLPSELVGLLTNAEKSMLGINILDCDTIIKFFKDYDFTHGNFIEVRDNDWKYLIEGINKNDTESCKAALRLPVFPIQDNRYTAFDPKTYFEEKTAIPELFLDSVNRCQVKHENFNTIFENARITKQVWDDFQSLRFCCTHPYKYSPESLLPIVKKSLKALLAHGEFDADQEMLNFLHTSKILTSKNGNAYAPSQVLDLGEFSLPCGQLQDLDICLAGDLVEDEYESGVQSWIRRKLYPSREECLTTLGAALSCYNDEYCIGNLDVNEELVDEFLRTNCNDILPITKILRQLMSKPAELSKTECCAILKELCQTIEADKLLQICNRLTVAIAATGTKTLPNFYLSLMSELTKAENFSAEYLPRMRLFNMAWDIKSPQELVSRMTGLALENTLLDQYGNLFGVQEASSAELAAHFPNFKSTRNLSIDNWKAKVAQTPSKLEVYFDGWSEELNCHIATLIYLCDDTEELKSYARRRWERDADGIRSTIHDELKTRCQGRRLFIDVRQGKCIELVNLLGQKISVSTAQLNDLKSLLLGDSAYACYTGPPIAGARLPEGTKSMYLCLRDLNDAERRQLGTKRMTELLKNTIDLVVKALGVIDTDTALISLWHEIECTEQLDIEIVRETILDQLQSYLPSLGVRDSKINPLIEKWHDLLKDAKQAKLSKDFALVDNKIAEIKETMRELRETFEQEQDCLADVLQAVVKRITAHCGYDCESIPFELFQNADDATLELINNNQEANRNHPIVFSLTDNSLDVMHFGRPINKPPTLKEIDNRRANGYRNDLEKMLLFWRSDKEVGELKRTGKFGLGFKSIYQITNMPVITSGNLRFAIKGSLYPVDQTEEQVKLLQGIRKDLNKYIDNVYAHHATIMHLPFNNHGQDTTINFDSFLSAADLLMIFSRAIKEIHLFVQGSYSKICYHKVTSKYGFDIISTRPGKTGHDYAVLPLPEAKVSIVFKYNAANDGSLLPIDSSLPTIWITEPSKECFKLGFAVNGDFDVDIGRNAVMENTHNGNLVKNASKELYNFFHNQHSVGPFSTTWLISLWNCLSGKEDNSGSWNPRNSTGIDMYLLRFIWGSKDNPSGYGKFISETRAIPNGFPSPWHKMLCLPECECYLDEELSKEKTLSLCWQFMAEDYGTAVSFKTHQILANILDIKLEKIALVNILTHWLMHHNGTPENLNGKPWGEIIDLFPYNTIKQEFSDIARTYKFENCCGVLTGLNHLLYDDANQETESKLLLAFAPHEAKLSTEYDQDAICLFKSLRSSNLQFDADSIAMWVEMVSSDEQVAAVCRYLNLGANGLKLAQVLNHNNIGKDKIKKAIAMRLCNFKAIAEIITEEKANEDSDPSHADNGTSGNSITWSEYIVDTSDIEGEGPENDTYEKEDDDWEWLRQNWQKHKEEIIEKYNNENYGTKAISPWPNFSELEDMSNRQRWMELFILALCRSFGRQTNYQHAGFIKLCRQKRWMNIFADCDRDEDQSSKYKKWMQILDSYFDQLSDNYQYQHWMNIFPWIYQFNRFLADYVFALEQWRKPEAVPDNFKALLTFRSNPAWEGSAMKCPPLDLGLGTIGSHWLYRELVRSQTIANKHLHRYCFVPSKSVRKLFGGDAVKSEQIYDRVNREHFDLQFDIAFKTFDYK